MHDVDAGDHGGVNVGDRVGDIGLGSALNQQFDDPRAGEKVDRGLFEKLLVPKLVLSHACHVKESVAVSGPRINLGNDRMNSTLNGCEVLVRASASTVDYQGQKMQQVANDVHDPVVRVLKEGAYVNPAP